MLHSIHTSNTTNINREHTSMIGKCRGYLLPAATLVIAYSLGAGCLDEDDDVSNDPIGVNSFLKGACCTDEGCADLLTEAECLEVSGVSFPDESCGAFSPCRGACCRNDECFVAAGKNECGESGGEFKGSRTNCDDAGICVDAGTPGFSDSEQTGICCLDESCVAVPLDECTGTVFFASDNCNRIDCTKGACCDTLLDDCVESSRKECVTSATGEFAGPGTTCADTDCSLGACCTANGSNCTDVSEADCLAGGGAFKGIGTNCDRNLCLPIPCCQTDGSCVELVSEACRSEGGAPLPVDKDCSDLPCSTGLCCLLFPSDEPFGDCRDDFTQSGCEGRAGTFAGLGLTCAENTFDAVTAISIDDISNVPETGTLGETSFALNVTLSGNPAFPVRLQGYLDVDFCPPDVVCPAATRRVDFRPNQLQNRTITIEDWNVCPGLTTVTGYAEAWRFRIVDQHCVASDTILVVMRCEPK